MALLFPSLARPTDRSALLFGERTMSHRVLARACAAHAADLARGGLVPGDRVAVWTDPGPATVIALLGNALAGIVTVPLNPKLGARELGHILTDAAPRRVFAADPAAHAGRTPSLEVSVPLVDGAASGAPPERAVDDAPLLLLYTSGTTGAPKGAVLTARNVAANLDALADAWGFHERDTVVHALPLFHVHGLVLGLFGSLRVGGALHLLPRFDPQAVGAALAAQGTMLFAVPTMYHRLANAAEADASLGRALGGARLLISGSAGLPLREHRRIERLTGRGIHERYGLTETLINCAVRHDGPPRPGFVGPPLAGVELRLVDDARRPLEAPDPETLGEVAVRGPSVFAGYLNRPDATAQARDADGWFYTGDIASRAPDGAIRIAGRRATDLIKTGGFKVGAGEVEACLLEDAGVAEAAVIGVADADLGERIVAFVVPRDPARPPSPEALVAFVSAELASHKRPREVRVVPSLPRNAMGKVQKARLQQAHEERGDG